MKIYLIGQFNSHVYYETEKLCGREEIDMGQSGIRINVFKTKCADKYNDPYFNPVSEYFPMVHISFEHPMMCHK